MESSFFEYRDTTAAEDESDPEIIDNSLIVDQSLNLRKNPAFKNHTVFIAESDESSSDVDTGEEDKDAKCSSGAIRRSSVVAPPVVSSSDGESNGRGSNRSRSDVSNETVTSSDEEMSPEIVPRLRPKTARRSSVSLTVRKNRKRMVLADSDSENSIVIEHNKNSKHVCLNKTPAKFDRSSLACSVSDKCGDATHLGLKGGKERIDKDSDSINDHTQLHREDNDNVDNGTTDSSEVHSDSNDNEDVSVESCEDNEDRMMMSRATRMSIMGFLPKETPSDDSDYIQSDENFSRPGSVNSLAELPDVSLRKSAAKQTRGNKGSDNDLSTRTRSPLTSPLKDLSNKCKQSFEKDDRYQINKIAYDVCDLTQNESNDVYDLTSSKHKSLTSKVLSRLKSEERTYKETDVDDEVTVVETPPEVIALSSDDDDHVEEEKKSPKVKTALRQKDRASTQGHKVNGDMKQYLLPPSYPGQVVYVQAHVRARALRELEGLQADLYNVRNLLENMDVYTLPDGGVKLIERLTTLERDVRRQGDMVAKMVVEPDNPTAEQIAKDGFKTEKPVLSWDDIKKASDAVQPRMFGKQAMSTHMAERNVILERLRDLHESLDSRPPEDELAAPPAALKTPLMPHQRYALTWLLWRETQRPRGGILADDMGLGKTITMISLIASDKERDQESDDESDAHDARAGKSSRSIQGGTLVVCPASLMQQWAEEVQKHCLPHRLSVCLHHGASRSVHPHRLAVHDLVLTTYNILLREVEKNGALCRVRWRRCILDEAHAVRNHKSATAGAVLPGRLRARRRWALTGTPLHNRDLDLFALLRFLGCSPFDELTMWKKWIDNKSLGGQERLNTIMRCIMLRRTKLQLQERGQLSCLPDREVHEREVTLAREEINVYQKLMVLSKTLFAQFLHQRAEKHADAQSLSPTPHADKDSAYAKMHKKMVKLQGAKPVKSHEILVLLLRLRQVCCHCGLIAAMLSEEDATADQLQVDNAENDLLDELNKLVLEDKETKQKSDEHEEEDKEDQDDGITATEAVRSVLSHNNPVFALDRCSSKIAAVMDCLEQNVFANPGEKAVVVSQWTGVLQLVERELQRARVQCVTLSGQVPVPARAALVNELNNPKSPVRVMLLSLTAGGVGLNLCGANHLLLLDPHWNPQLEQQAQDRVYRVGQQRHVHIYRFMCVDTVEQTIRKLQRTKLELADSVLTGARHNASKLSIEDLKMLFNMAQ